MENLNLCEILKGHEGETFYSPAFGVVILKEIRNDHLSVKNIDTIINLYKDGRYNIYGKCIIFPSKDQLDWNKWIEEQKPKVPKTWSEYTKQFDISSEPTLWFDSDMNWGEIGKACAALFKIHRLIEVGYGGNVTNEEWKSKKDKWIINLICSKNGYSFIVLKTTYFVDKCHIAFHTEKQAREFIRYSENIQLLRDYNIV